jgi:hypothetical protein
LALRATLAKNVNGTRFGCIDHFSFGKKMPRGLPTASELMESKSVTFFSIDTDIIQSLGYKFQEGALFALRLQRPSWLHIVVTEIVQREVMAHRIEPVEQSIEELRGALARAQRLSGYDMSEVQRVISEMPLAKTSRDRFVVEFRQFLDHLGGSVLPFDGPDLARQMFTRYFSQLAPFEARKEKKSEFPDAAALLVLESYARERKTRGILISKDGGWSNFAKDSESLYCVKTLDDFVALFKSTGENADLVKGKVKVSLQDPAGDLNYQIEQELARYVEGAFWRAGDPYSDYSLRVESDVVGVGYDSCELNPDALSLWFVEHDPTLCTVELALAVNVDLNVSNDFYQYDTIDHDEFIVASDEVEKRVQIEVDVFLTCRGDLLKDAVDDWEVEIGISGGDFRFEVGRVNPRFDDDDDR